jgi:FkbM family methyltransferase
MNRALILPRRLFLRAGTTLRELDRSARFLRDRRVQRRLHLFWVWWKLRFLARYRPGWTKPLRFLGFKVSYPAMIPLRWIFEEIFINREYAPEEGAKVERVVDAGANIGLATLFFKHHFPDVQITCFEPDPTNFSFLQRNLEQNGLEGVTVHNVALAPEEGTATLYFNAAVRDTCQSVSRGFAESVAEELEPAEIRAVPLAPYLEQPVDILKMDIEGAEAAVLRAARDSLANVSMIRLEYHRAGDNRLHDVLETVEHAGHDYRVSGPSSSEQGDVVMVYTRRRGDGPNGASAAS